MVSFKEVKAANGQIDDSNAPKVAVFVGGTAGIGQLTIKALVATGASVKIYLIGRPAAEQRMRSFIDELRRTNARADVVLLKGEVALLAGVRKVCEAIRSRESRVDLLFLSAGYAPFRGREDTAEGVEVVQSLEYYSRILFAQLLMPLLAAADGRVQSVLAGSMERDSLTLDDIDLRKPGAYGPFSVQTQCALMNSVTLEALADRNPAVTFIHSWPGWVNTGNVRRGLKPDSILAWIIWLLLEPLIALLSFSDDESGQRHLFQSTSAAFGGKGVPWKGKPGVSSQEKSSGGLYLVTYKSNCTPNAKVMTKLRVKAREQVWDHTQEVLRPYL